MLNLKRSRGQAILIETPAGRVEIRVLAANAYLQEATLDVTLPSGLAAARTSPVGPDPARFGHHHLDSKALNFLGKRFRCAIDGEEGEGIVVACSVRVASRVTCHVR